MSGCEIMKCKWWRGTSQSCAEPIGVCIYSQDAAITALRNELTEYKRLCQGHVLAEQQWREENERLSDVKRLVQEYPLTAEGMAQLRTRLAVAEGKVEKVRRTIHDPMVCEYQQMRNRIIEDLRGEP